MPGFEPQTVQPKAYWPTRYTDCAIPASHYGNGIRCFRARWELMLSAIGNTLFCTTYNVAVLTNANTSLLITQRP
jgi:hypothetical protein